MGGSGIVIGIVKFDDMIIIIKVDNLFDLFRFAIIILCIVDDAPSPPITQRRSDSLLHRLNLLNLLSFRLRLRLRLHLLSLRLPQLLLVVLVIGRGEVNERSFGEGLAAHEEAGVATHAQRGRGPLGRGVDADGAILVR